MDSLLSDDESVIAIWAREALADGLHRPGNEGCARYSLWGVGRIYRMAYLPGVAWVIYCDYVYPPSDYHGKPRWQAFTRPDMRHQGIFTSLWNLVTDRWPDWKNPLIPESPKGNSRERSDQASGADDLAGERGHQGSETVAL